MKILVVDDSREDRDLIITYIKKSENGKTITIDESNCIKKAKEKIDVNTYDVIILDLALPETDGIDTVKTIQTHLQNLKKDTPIVVLTGIEDYNIGRQAWDMGIKEYLIKDDIEKQDISRALTFASYKNGKQKKKQKKIPVEY